MIGGQTNCRNTQASGLLLGIWAEPAEVEVALQEEVNISYITFD